MSYLVCSLPCTGVMRLPLSMMLTGPKWRLSATPGSSFLCLGATELSEKGFKVLI